jgi:O-antigen/teichoic acid export membrane protein
LNLLSSIVIARVIGKVGYGEIGIIQSTISMFGVFAGLGLGITATKYIAQYRKTNPVKAGKILTISLIVAVVSGIVMVLTLMTFAPVLAEKSLAAPHLSPLLRFGAVILLLEAINGALVGALAGFESFRAIARVNFLAALIAFPITLIGVWLAGLQGVIVGLILLSLLNCIFNSRALQKICLAEEIRIRFIGCLDELTVLWHFSFPAFLSNAMVGPVTWLCNAMLVKQSNGYAEMGLFNAANQWRNLLMLLPGIFSAIALPMLSSTPGPSDENKFVEVFNLNQRASILAAVPLGIILMLAGDLALMLYGKDFSNGYEVMVGLVAGVTISCIGGAAGSAIQAQGKMWLGLFLNFIWAAVYLIYVYFTVAKQGAMSLSIGFALAHFVLLLVGYLYMYKKITSAAFTRMIISVGIVALVGICAVTFASKIRYLTILPALACTGIFIRYYIIKSNKRSINFISQ